MHNFRNLRQEIEYACIKLISIKYKTAKTSSKITIDISLSRYQILNIVNRIYPTALTTLKIHPMRVTR